LLVYDQGSSVDLFVQDYKSLYPPVMICATATDRLILAGYKIDRELPCAWC